VTDAGASARAAATTDAHAHAKSASVIRFATFERFVGGIVDVARVVLSRARRWFDRSDNLFSHLHLVVAAAFQQTTGDRKHLVARRQRAKCLVARKTAREEGFTVNSRNASYSSRRG